MEYKDPEELRTAMVHKLRDEEEIDLEFEKDNILDQLFTAVIACRKEFNWSNVRILNKKPELVKFKEAWDQNGSYEPTFKFTSFTYDVEEALDIVNRMEEQTSKIDREIVATLGLKEIDRHDLRDLFRGAFEEYKLYIHLHSNIAYRDRWRENCRKIWRFNNKTAHYANQQLQKKSFDAERSAKTLSASDVGLMWKEEVERLGMDGYNVEIRDVAGCHNVPEDQTLVVAAGDDEERKYSPEEAKMLTVHEVFHAARCYNGFKVLEDSGMPPILGVHTPFYDRAEEGGAVFREFKTGVLSDHKERDYYLRTMAAHHWNQGLSLEKSVQKLIDLGASLKRAFALAARNREVMRHQIYLGGHMDWQEMDSLEHMMVGKVNQDWAQKFWREVQSEGPLNEPEVTPKQLFQNREFAFDT